MKSALVIAGIVVAVIAAIGVRVVVSGKRALADGDAALEAKRPLDAIAGWESAARWYFPFAPHVDDAYERLVKLAEDPEHALAAWRAVRRAAYATRSLWTPHAGDLAKADAAIAKLSAEAPDGAPASGQNAAERTAFFAARLADDPRPSTGAVSLAILGILSLLAGIGVVVRCGIGPAGFARRAVVIGAALTVTGVVAWAVGLYNA